MSDDGIFEVLVSPVVLQSDKDSDGVITSQPVMNEIGGPFAAEYIGGPFAAGYMSKLIYPAFAERQEPRARSKCSCNSCVDAFYDWLYGEIFAYCCCNKCQQDEDDHCCCCDSCGNGDCGSCDDCCGCSGCGSCNSGSCDCDCDCSD